MLPVLFALFIWVPLLGLDTTLTADEGYWVQRTTRFGAALARGDLNSTYRSGHPGVTVMWIGLLGIGPTRLEPFLSPSYINFRTVERAPSYLEVLAHARRAIVVATAGLAVVIVALTWRLFGPGPALVSGALLLLDPYLVGMTRLLHPDALLAPLIAVAVLASLVFWTANGGWRYLLLSAVATGLALLTKSPALTLTVFFVLVGFVTCLTRRRWRIWRRALLVWAAVVVFTIWACWPALWVNPVGRLGDVVEFITRVGGQPHRWPNVFLGQRFTSDPGPLFYPVALAVRLSPVGLAGLLALVLVLRRRRVHPAILGLLGFGLLFVVVMTIGSKKLDRYMLPAILLLNVLAGVGLWSAARALSGSWRRVSALLLALGIQVALFWQASPYLLSAYSPLVGGVSGARQLVLVGWGEGLDQVVSYLNGLPDAERLVVATHYHDILRPQFRGTTIRLYGEGRFDYGVVYVNMLQRNLMPTSVRKVMASQQPEFTAYVQGAPYAWVYRLPTGAQESTEDASEDQDFGDDYD